MSEFIQIGLKPPTYIPDANHLLSLLMRRMTFWRTVYKSHPKLEQKRKQLNANSCRSMSYRSLKKLFLAVLSYPTQISTVKRSDASSIVMTNIGYGEFSVTDSMEVPVILHPKVTCSLRPCTLLSLWSVMSRTQSEP